MTSPPAPTDPGRQVRIAVPFVAYNAATTLRQALARLPNDSRDRLDPVLVYDDISVEETFEIGLEYATGSTLPLMVIEHVEDLRRGGNQARIFSPLMRGEADVVMGSRTLDRGSERA